MWSQLSSGLAKYTDVASLKARAQHIRGQIGEFAQEVLQDIEESEAVAKNNVEKYRQERDSDTILTPHTLPEPINGGGVESVTTHTGGGDGGGHFGDTFSNTYASSPLYEATPATVTYPPSALTHAANANTAAVNNDSNHHFNHATNYQQQPHLTHAAYTNGDAHVPFSHPMHGDSNGGITGVHSSFPSSHPPPPLTTNGHDVNGYGINQPYQPTIAIDPYSHGHTDPASFDAYNHTPVSDSHVQQSLQSDSGHISLVATSSSSPDDVLVVDDGVTGLMVEASEVHSPLDLSLDESSGLAGVDGSALDQSIAEEVDLDTPTAHAQMTPHVDHANAMITQAQHLAALHEQQHVHATAISDLQHASDVSQQGLRHEIQSLQDQLHHAQQSLIEAAALAERQTNRVRELELACATAERRASELQHNLDALDQARQNHVDHAASPMAVPAPAHEVSHQSSHSIEPSVTTSTTGVVDEDESIDLSALLGDAMLPSTEKINLLVEEIELLRMRVSKLKNAPAASSSDSAVVGNTNSNSDAASGDVDVASLQSTIDDLTSQVESLTDEKSMLNDILSELRSESETVLNEAMERSASNERLLQEQLVAIRLEMEAYQEQARRIEEKDDNTSTGVSAEFVATLQSQLDASRQRITELESQHDAASQQIDELKHQLELKSLDHTDAHSNAIVHTDADGVPTVVTGSDDSTVGSTLLEQKYTDLKRAYEKLSTFRTQAVAWKSKAEEMMHKLKTRKEEIQLRARMSEKRWLKERQACRLELERCGGDVSIISNDQMSEVIESISETPSAAASPCKSAPPTPMQQHPLPPTPQSSSSMVDATDLLRQEHAAAIELVQAQLSLARQQLSMQHVHIESLQREVESHSTFSEDTLKARDLENEERIRHEYIPITNNLAQQLTERSEDLQSEQIRCQHLKNELEEQCQKMDILQTSLKLIEQQSQDTLNERLQTCRNDYETKLAELTREHTQVVEKLQTELETSRESNTSMMTQLQGSQEFVQQQQRQLEEMNTHIQTLMVQIEQAQTQLQQAQQQHLDANMQLQQAHQQIHQLTDELQSVQSQLTDARAQVESARSAPPPEAATVAPADSALIDDLRAQVESLKSQNLNQADQANAMVNQLNARYEQLLHSFTSLQAQCRAGLDGEEGNLAQIAELRTALAESQSSLAQAHADVERMQGEVRRVEQTKGELAIMSARWREAMSEADGLRKIVKEQTIVINELRESESRSNGEEGGIDGTSLNGFHSGDIGTSSSSSSSSSVEDAEELRALRQEVHHLKLDAASMSSLQSDYAALQRAHDMAQDMLVEARTAGEDLRRALHESQMKVANMEKEIEQLRSSLSSHTNGSVSSSSDPHTYEVLTKQLSELQQTLQLKSTQLSEMSHYTSSLEQDNMNLRKSFETTLHKLKHFSSEEHLVDRRLVVKMLVTYFERKDKDEVLELMGKVLQFTKDDMKRIQKGRQGVFGMIGSLLAAPSTSHVDTSTGGGENLADSWIEFLMQESNKAEQEKAIGGGGSVTKPAPSPPSRRPESNFHRESEFESPFEGARAPVNNTHSLPIIPPSQVIQPILPTPVTYPPQPIAFQTPPHTHAAQAWIQPPATAPAPGVPFHLPPPPFQNTLPAPPTMPPTSVAPPFVMPPPPLAAPPMMMPPPPLK